MAAPAMPAGSAPSTGRPRVPTYSGVNLWTIAAAAALIGAALFVLGSGGAWEGAGILACIALGILITCRTTVTVERHGVRATLGVFSFPRRFVGIDQIRRAVVVNVRPFSDFGGWGYRRGNASWAFVCRRGEALRLEFFKGPAFIVTIDEARRAADRINAYVQERGPVASRPKRKRRSPVTKPWF